MSEQELQELTDKLRPIWDIDEEGLVLAPEGQMLLGRLLDGVHFHHWVSGNLFFIGSPEGQGAIDNTEGVIVAYATPPKSDPTFINHWLPMFRRGCFLSGWPSNAVSMRN